MTTKTDPIRYIFFGGKGGVGKTTCAAAFALRAPGRVLAISTDPAHSLGDALGVRLSSRPTPVGPTRRLLAAELDAPRAFARWVEQHRAALADILEHGTWLDRDDIDALLELSMPGVDELMGLIEIDRLADAQRAKADPYDLVVVDTAPTGHTLRLLAAPDAVSAVAQVLDALQEEHRVIRERLARVARPEAADRLIALLAEQAHAIASHLRDEARTALRWVTLPEELSLAETRDAVASLEHTGLRVDEIIVNRVLPPDPHRCRVCDRRRAEEARIVAGIRGTVGRGRRVRTVPADVREPRGVAALTTIGRALAGRQATPGKPRRDRARIRRVPAAMSLAAGASTTPAEDIAAVRDATLLFFGGKGGVGKTTAAAAAAVRIARAHPRRRVLLLSTDPAHSLGDVFGHALGDRPSAIPSGPKNLVVREVDAAAALAARKTELESAIDEISNAVGASASAAASELMELAPPGIDELFGILSVVDAGKAFETIVVDTAPTGHALRLLEMPEAARAWVQVLLRVLLKYRTLLRPGQLAEELVEASQAIRALQTQLRNGRLTHFVVVTRAAKVPWAETARLLERLKRLRLAAPAVLINAMTLAPGGCRRCRAIAAAERAVLRTARTACARRACAIIQAPLAAPPPRGVKALEAWGARWNLDS